MPSTSCWGRSHAQLGRLDLLHRITRAIGERQDLQSIYQVVIRSLEDNLSIDFGCVCLYDPAAETLTVTSVGLRSGALAIELALTEQARIPVDQNGLTRCVRGHLVYEPDINAVPFPRASRAAGGVGVLFMDLDRFKAVNDSLGHPAGDALLREVAERLPRCLREADTAARWGSDEFIVLVPDLPGNREAAAEAVAVVIEKVQAALAKPALVEGQEVDVSTSIGVTLYPWDGSNVTDLIKRADTAMYQAKGSGREHLSVLRRGHGRSRARTPVSGQRVTPCAAQG